MPYCWKSHALAHTRIILIFYIFVPGPQVSVLNYILPLKVRGYYGIPSVKNFVLSVRPSVTILFPLSILSIFDRFSSNFIYFFNFTDFTTIEYSHVLHRLISREKHEKIFLSKTTRPKALIFGLKHQLLNLYQAYSNYILGAEMAHLGCHLFYIALYKEKHEKIFFSETIRLRALIFGM